MAPDNDDKARTPDGILKGATAIVGAYVAHNPIAASDVVALIRSVHGALAGLSPGSGPAVTTQKPAVPIRRSVFPDHIVCLEDGRKFKSLKRYLRTKFKLTPDEYRARWGLPHDYPMVAPNSTAWRSQFAKKIGLGKTRKSPPVTKRKRA